jgi:acyl-homoserine-lactone acylase
MVLNSRALHGRAVQGPALPMVCATPTINVATDPQTGEAISARSVDVRGLRRAAGVGQHGRHRRAGAHVWDEFWNRASQIPAATLYNVPFEPPTRSTRRAT